MYKQLSVTPIHSCGCSPVVGGGSAHLNVDDNSGCVSERGPCTGSAATIHTTSSQHAVGIGGRDGQHVSVLLGLNIQSTDQVEIKVAIAIVS